jgi:hypothetical protein
MIHPIRASMASKVLVCNDNRLQVSRPGPVVAMPVGPLRPSACSPSLISVTRQSIELVCVMDVLMAALKFQHLMCKDDALFANVNVLPSMPTAGSVGSLRQKDYSREKQ